MWLIVCAQPLQDSGRVKVDANKTTAINYSYSVFSRLVQCNVDVWPYIFGGLIQTRIFDTVLC